MIRGWRGVRVPGGFDRRLSGLITVPVGETSVGKVIDLGGAGMFAVGCERLFCGN